MTMSPNSTFTDIKVKCGNPVMLDNTVQLLGSAAVIENSWDGETCMVRIFGKSDFIKFAIEAQGYGKIIQEKESK